MRIDPRCLWPLIPHLSSFLPSLPFSLSFSLLFPLTFLLDFTINHARLVIEGTIWKSLENSLGSGFVSFVESVFHPVTLTPTYMNAGDLKKGMASVSLTVHFGDTPDVRISHETLFKYERRRRRKKRRKRSRN